MDGHPKPTSQLQKTPGNGLHKPKSSRNPGCKYCPKLSTKSLTNEAPKTCPENGPRAHIGAQRPGIWAGKAGPKNVKVGKHSDQFQTTGRTGSKPGMHGQHTVPQFVRMLACRVYTSLLHLTHVPLAPMDDAAFRTVRVTYVGSRPEVHGQATMPQFVRMLSCRVSL